MYTLLFGIYFAICAVPYFVYKTYSIEKEIAEGNFAWHRDREAEYVFALLIALCMPFIWPFVLMAKLYSKLMRTYVRNQQTNDYY